MVQRVPIIIQRQSIKLPVDIKMQLRLREVQEECKEDEILAMAEHYNMLVIKNTNKGGYTCLPQQDYKRHRNWKHFEAVWEICRMKGWSTRLYMEAQFDRAKNWTSMPYPQPSTMYSVNAIKHFVSYYGMIIKKHKYDTNIKEKKKGSQTLTLTRMVVDGIVESVGILDMYLKNSKFDDKAQYKAIKIYQSWEELSPYYLWSVPWFHNILDKIGDSVRAEECRKEFQRISGSRSLRETIGEVVQRVENEFNIPHNIDL